MNWRFVVDWVPVITIPIFITLFLFFYLALTKYELPLPQSGKQNQTAPGLNKVTLFFPIIFTFVSSFTIVLLPLTTPDIEAVYNQYLLLLIAGLIFFVGLLLTSQVVTEKWK